MTDCGPALTPVELALLEHRLTDHTDTCQPTARDIAARNLAWWLATNDPNRDAGGTQAITCARCHEPFTDLHDDLAWEHRHTRTDHTVVHATCCTDPRCRP